MSTELPLHSKSAQHNDMQAILGTIPSQFRGPGGALAIVKDGEAVATKTWGYANMDKRTPVTTKTLMPICSISKQMVCALLFDLEQNPPLELADKGSFADQMEHALKEMVPEALTKDSGLTIRDLADMKSGLRDYWALAMICGAKPDQRFTIQEDGFKMLSLYRTFHFPPGTEHSYSNINFFLLGRLIEKLTGRPLPELLKERVFGPAGMTTADLIPDTAKQPGDCLGYEGNEYYGFLAAVNRIEWSGDAGITASIEDMIAYEKYFDKQWVEKGEYSAAASAHSYKDGTYAPYSYGLSWYKIGGKDSVGHGGALRGWRIHRRYVPEDRLSVVVMLNHENSQAANAASTIIRKVLALPNATHSAIEPAAAWFGYYLDEETHLAITVTKAPKGKISMRYERDAENIQLVAPDRAEDADNIATIEGDTLKIHRVGDNRHLIAKRIKQEPRTDGSKLQGKYYCEELKSTFICEGQDGMLYGAFDGPLGHGPANLMRRLGENVWAWACPRALDHTPPGDWTIVFKEDQSGKIAKCIVGCWLARNLEFIAV